MLWGALKLMNRPPILAVCLALASSFRNRPVDPHTAVMGEVGLTGEVRMVGRADLRVKEATALGFKRIVIPAGNAAGLKISHPGIVIKGVNNIEEAMEVAFCD